MSQVMEVKDLKVYFDIKRGFIDDMLSKEKLQVKAVDGIDLTIGKGEIFSLVGESGSGKTTIGKTILDLIPATQGDIVFLGDSLKHKSKAEKKKFRQKAQMIFQDPYQSLNPKDIILDIVAEPLQVNGLIKNEKEKMQKVVNALEMAGLTPAEDFLYRYPHELSGGQRQRVAIAGAIVLDPEFIVADEPVSMLDVSIRIGILNLMMALRDRKGISYLFITHDLSLAWVISDRIAILYLGKIMEMGRADTIIHECLHPYSQSLISVMPVPAVNKEKERIILHGETPDPIHLPEGCRFHPRCPKVFEKCCREEPELTEVAPGHFAACHRIGERGRSLDEQERYKDNK